MNAPPEPTMNQNDKPPNQNLSNESKVREEPRTRPILLRIYADNQDKKSLCLFWGIFIGVMILITIIASFALPPIFRKLTNRGQLAGSVLTNCTNPVGFNGDQLYCQNFSSSNLQVGAALRQVRNTNQFAMFYLAVVTQNNTPNVNQNISLNLYSMVSMLNVSDNTYHLFRKSLISNATGLMSYDARSTDSLYSQDQTTLIGYQVLVGIVTQLGDQQDLFLSMILTQYGDFQQSSSVYLQTYVINDQFTIYTIVIRYVFLAIATISCILYLYRYCKVPAEFTIIEQKLIAIASILIIMFNDPFYAATILIQNPVSSFYSTFVISNMVVWILLMWLVFIDRILYQDGQKDSQMPTKFQIGYVVIVWILMITLYMMYAMSQLNGQPIISGETGKFKVVAFLLGIAYGAGIVYIVVQYVRICMLDESRMWRSQMFMFFSIFFIFAMVLFLLTNSLGIFNYSAEQILLVYTLTNLYIIYLQYMYTVTTQEMSNLPLKMHQEEANERLTVGTIEMVDIDVEDDSHQQLPKFSKAQQHSQTLQGYRDQEEKSDQFKFEEENHQKKPATFEESQNFD